MTGTDGPPSPKIRRATPGDARGIALVHIASWRWAYRGLVPDTYLDALDPVEREARWANELGREDLVTFVAESEGSIVGFAGAGPSRDGDALHDTVGELYAIYVSEAAAGAGIGSNLLGRIMSELRDRGYEIVTCWVLEENRRARSFYERHGWSWDGSRKDHDFDSIQLSIVRYTSARPR